MSGPMALPAIEDGRAEAFWLCALLALLPFELRQPTLPLLGFETTLLEAMAALVGIALLWLTRDRLKGLLRRPPLPVALLAAYAAVHLISALAADVHRAEALKFALRMAVMAGFAALVAGL